MALIYFYEKLKGVRFEVVLVGILMRNLVV